MPIPGHPYERATSDRSGRRTAIDVGLQLRQATSTWNKKAPRTRRSTVGRARGAVRRACYGYGSGFVLPSVLIALSSREPPSIVKTSHHLPSPWGGVNVCSCPEAL